MTGINVADFFVGAIQYYILSNLMCKIHRRKYSYGKTMSICLLLFCIQYIFWNYGTHTLPTRIITGITGFAIIGILIYDGNLFYKLGSSGIDYAVFVGLDLMCQFFIFPWVPVTLQSLTLSSGVLFARNLYNLTGYSCVVLYEWYRNRKEGGNLKLVSFLAVALAAGQICMMYLIFQVNADGLLEHIVGISVFYSGLAIMGYYMTMELFYRILDQQKKKNKLEQKAMERQYQYDYYLLARKQSEEIRDIRHDMRNQLQTMQYLLHSEKEEERNRAAKMLSDLQKRLG